MAEKNIMTSQVVCLKTSKKTFAAYAKSFEAAAANRFFENRSLSGKEKITFEINDHTNGTGDLATKVEFNLDPKNVLYLYETAKQVLTTLNFQGCAVVVPNYYLSKTFGKWPETTGPNKGYCKTRSFQVTYDPAKNYCWTVKIINGYAIPEAGPNGTFSAKKGTAKDSKTALMNFSKEDFLNIMEQCWSFIQAAADVFRQESLVKIIMELNKKYSQSPVPAVNANDAAYEQALAAMYSQGTYQEQTPAVPVPSQPAPAPAPAAAPEPAQAYAYAPEPIPSEPSPAPAKKSLKDGCSFVKEGAKMVFTAVAPVNGKPSLVEVTTVAEGKTYNAYAQGTVEDFQMQVDNGWLVKADIIRAKNGSIWLSNIEG